MKLPRLLLPSFVALNLHALLSPTPTNENAYATPRDSLDPSKCTDGDVRHKLLLFADYAPECKLNIMQCTPGKLREYTFIISREYVSPDGVNTSMILANGQFPGPTIEANLGDTFRIHVINQIDDNQGTALHWHGLFQKISPWMDGVPSVTFCPIPPGGSFTYEFVADRVGSSWWHSHYSAQIAAGLSGAMIIRGPTPYTYDVDLGPVLLSDHLHFDYRHMINGTLHAEVVSTSNNLINGKSEFNCSDVEPGGPRCKSNSGYSIFRFHSGKSHLLRLVNSGLEALQHFAIDGHAFTIVGLDYTPIEPYETDIVSLTPGQRVDIVVHASAEPKSSFWMRSDVDPTCSASSHPHAKAIIHYEHANSSVPVSNATAYTLTGDCVAQPLSQTRPLVPQPLSPSGPTHVQTLNYTLAFNYTATGAPQFLVNGRQFRANYSQALLSIAADTSTEFGALSNVFDFAHNSTVRIVLYNFFISPHPIHLHGHDFWILAEGRGGWSGSIQGNSDNLMRRDTHQMIGATADGLPSFLVLEFELDNPGVWAFHCHISQHLILGMYLNIVYGQDTIQKYKIPSSIEASCASWREFESRNLVEQPDSGL